MLQELDPVASAEALVDKVDWASTPLGPRARWPQSLRAVVDLVLASPIGMVLMWGPDGLLIYNDGYVPICGARHPAAFGRTAKEMWPEIWDWNRAILERGFRGEPMTYRDHHLVVERNGAPEDIWFDLFYTPVRDDGGTVGGVLCTVIDTTAHMLAITSQAESEKRLARSEARLSMLVNQASVGITQSNLAGVLVAANDRFCDIIGRPRDAVIGASMESFTHPADRAVSRAASTRLLEDGKAFISEKRLVRPDGQAVWVHHHVSLARDAAGLPEFVIRITQDISDRKEAEMLARESTEQRRRAAQRQAFLIALADRLRTLEEPRVILDAMVRMAGAELDAASVSYGEVSPDGESIEILAQWPAGIAAADTRMPSVSLGTGTARRLRAGDASLSPPGTAERARMAVPLLREGRWHAVMIAVARSPRAWTGQDIDLLREIIGRSWEAVERARAVLTLRKAQGRQAFLLRLNDHLSEIDEPREVLETVGEALGTYLGVTRAGYGEVSAEAQSISFEGAWSDGSVPAMNGSVGYAELTDVEITQLSRGLTVSEDGSGPSPEAGEPERPSLLGRDGMRSLLAVPLIRDGLFRAGLFLTHGEARRWTLEEISLTQEVARRTWEALERTRAEQALQRSEARLRAMFDTLPVGIMFAEMPSGRVTEGNARVEQILGYAAFATLDSATFEEWIAFDEAGRRASIEDHPLFIAVTAGETASRVFHHQRGDGTRVWIAVIAAPVRDAQGVITGGLLTIMDVDREKKAEAALRELNTTLEQQVAVRTRERDRVWRNSRDLLAVLGSQGNLLALNPSWTTILGWGVDDLAGLDLTAVLHPDDVPATELTLEALRRGPLAAPFETRLRHRDGHYLWVSWTATFEGDAIYANGRDVTAEKKQAEALRQAEEQLRQSQKMEAVGQLTGGIAHDFNNLLTGITGALDLLGRRLAQGRLDGSDRYIGMAMNSATRAASLTHRLLAFSRRQPLEAKPVDVNQLVGSMDDLMRRTLGERVALTVTGAEGLWLTLCDQHQLENALLNLVINARDAMPDGGHLTIATANVELAADDPNRESGTKPGRYVALSVSDSGTGMPPEVIARAFDPFFTTKPLGQGTGLGLSMIYGFAKQSDGTVRISSEVGKGTTVTLFLPRFRGRLVAAGEKQGVAARVGAGETILVVEDDPNVRDLVHEILDDLGYRALEAADGPAGLALLRSAEHIDLLVTDVGLPGLNGRQLADQGREIRPDLKVLFITGYAENASFGLGHLDAGMQMMTKPFAVESFAAKIKEMI